jgi:proton-translocating NADH-quinone oxidoreductase chain M
MLGVPLITAFIVSFQNKENYNRLLLTSTIGMLTTFLIILIMIANYDSSFEGFQFMELYPLAPLYNIYLSLSADSIALSLIFLTGMIMPLVLLSAVDLIRSKVFLISLLLMEFLLMLSFLVNDAFIFFIAFESTLIPMFIIIIMFGSHERRSYAAFSLFLFTLFGSLFMLITLFDIHTHYGSLNYFLLLNSQFPFEYQKKVFLGFFLAFAVKVPMLPFHNWLPEAHVEAPTAGSVILAAILLKLGVYGMVRFLIPICPLAVLYYTPLVLTICAMGVVYASMTAIRQTDMKRVIAYASIAHMNLIIMGLFSLTTQGLEGAILQSISHGFVSSGLFLCVGVLYDRYHSRIIEYYGGLAMVMPVFATIFFFFTIANIAFPLTSSFVGEFLILAGVFQTNPFAAFLGATGMVLSTIYSLWLYNRIMFGQLKDTYTKTFKDLNKREFWVFVPLVLGTVVLGIYPDILLNPLHLPVSCILEHAHSRILCASF